VDQGLRAATARKLFRSRSIHVASFCSILHRGNVAPRIGLLLQRGSTPRTSQPTKWTKASELRNRSAAFPVPPHPRRQLPLYVSSRKRDAVCRAPATAGIHPANVPTHQVDQSLRDTTARQLSRSHPIHVASFHSTNHRGTVAPRIGLLLQRGSTPRMSQPHQVDQSLRATQPLGNFPGPAPSTSPAFALQIIAETWPRVSGSCCSGDHPANVPTHQVDQSRRSKTRPAAFPVSPVHGVGLRCSLPPTTLDRFPPLHPTGPAPCHPLP
jgi:hypothetical protein